MAHRISCEHITTITNNALFSYVLCMLINLIPPLRSSADFVLFYTFPSVRLLRKPLKKIHMSLVTYYIYIVYAVLRPICTSEVKC